MSKTKEQCINIISQHFNALDDEKMDVNSSIKAMNESIKEICTSEFALIWFYFEEEKSIRAFIPEAKNILVEHSIFKEALESKNGFFDNHISSHRHYNPVFDNPFNIKMKSLLIYPVVKNNRVFGFLSAYNSVGYKEEFQRYDLRCLGLLNTQACKIIEQSRDFQSLSKIEKQENILNETSAINKNTNKNTKDKEIASVDKTVMEKIDKEKDIVNEIEIRDKKIQELEQILLERNIEEKRVEELEKKLLLKEEELGSLQDKTPVYELEPIDDESIEEHRKSVAFETELKVILNFLSNEVIYFHTKEQHLYLFLELIKSSLHNSNHIELINNTLENSMFLNNIFTELHNKEPILLEHKPFNVFQIFSTVTNLYTQAFNQKNITFNIFLDPRMPSVIISDQDKLRSILIHLLNNAYSLVEENGSIHFLLNYKIETEIFHLEIIGLKEKKKKNTMEKLFHSKQSVHSLSVGDGGVGLSVCSNLISLFNGKLKLSTSGEEEHSFHVTLPFEIEEYIPKDFSTSTDLQVAILLNEDNSNDVNLLQYYLNSFGLNKSNITLFNNFKTLENRSFSHLLCFENMLSKNLKLNNFTSVTILKYSDHNIDIDSSRKINELIITGYYGMYLQKILLPKVPVEKIDERSLLKDSKVFTKLKSRFK